MVAQYLAIILGVPITLYHTQWGVWIVALQDINTFVLALVNAVLSGTCRQSGFSSLCFTAIFSVGIFPGLFSLIRCSGIDSTTSMLSKSSSAARNGLLLKSTTSIIACLAHSCGTVCKRISLRSSYGIFLDSSDPGNLGKILFSSCILAVNCHSLMPLGLRIMHLISLLCSASALLGKKYFSSPFLISSRCFPSYIHRLR